MDSRGRKSLGRIRGECAGRRNSSVIDEYRFVLYEQGVSGNGNTALDIVDVSLRPSFVPVTRIFEHDHVASARAHKCWQAEMRNLEVCEWKIFRRFSSVNKFVDEKKIADPERVFHRRARDAECFNDERFQEEGENKGSGDRCRIIVEPIARRPLGSVLLLVDFHRCLHKKLAN